MPFGRFIFRETFVPSMSVMIHIMDVMHVIQFLVLPVPAFTTEAAYETLAQKIPGESWYDWYEIGGRWSGIFNQDPIHARLADDTVDVLPVKGNEAAVLRALDAVRGYANHEFASLRHAILGSTVLPAGHDGDILGIATASTAEQADRMTEYNRKQADGWSQILACDTLTDAQEAVQRTFSTYAVSQFLELVQGQWGSANAFYNTVTRTAKIDEFARLVRTPDERIRDIYDSLALVAVDFHC
jgi:hypothetical protein